MHLRRTTAPAWLALGAVLLLMVAGCDKTLPDVPAVDVTVTPLAPDTNIATPIGTTAPGARTTPGGAGPAASPTLGPNQYLVQAGDTLGLIAARFHTTVEAIRALNNIKGDLINVGQALNIPTPQPATDTVSTPSSEATTVAAAPTATTKPAAKATAGRVTYTVKRGDELSLIAKRFGVTTSALARANGITNPNSIQPGQVLVIPTGQ
jgi:LysM repeat protein